MAAPKTTFTDKLVNSEVVSTDFNQLKASANGAIDDAAAAQATASAAQPKETGKGLSTNDYTTPEKQKLNGIAANATANANTDSLAEGTNNLYFTTARAQAAVPVPAKATTTQAAGGTDDALYVTPLGVSSALNSRIPAGLLSMPTSRKAKSVAVSRFKGYTGLSDGTQTVQTAKYRIDDTMKVDCLAMEFKFGNWINFGGLPTNDITVAVYVFTGATFINIPFPDGNPSATIKPGMDVTTSISNTYFKRNGNTYIQVVVSVATLGMKWPLGAFTVSSKSEGFANSDIGTSTTGITTSNTQQYAPWAICASPISNVRQPVVGFISDSIGDGYGLTPGDGGFLRVGLDAQGAKWCRFSQNSAKIQDYLQAFRAYAVPRIVAEADYLIAEPITNDLAAWTTVVQGQNALIEFWRVLGSGGGRVIALTALPNTGLTTAQASNRASINDWMRDGAPIDSVTFAALAVGSATGTTVRFGQVGHPAYALINIALVVETGVNTNVWVSGSTQEGVHPSASGTALLSPLIQNFAFPTF